MADETGEEKKKEERREEKKREEERRKEREREREKKKKHSFNVSRVHRGFVKQIGLFRMPVLHSRFSHMQFRDASARARACEHGNTRVTGETGGKGNT